MNGKLVIAFMMLAGMILSACGSQSSAETSTPTLIETSEIPVTGNTATQSAATVEASVTPPAQTESASATPEPPRPPMHPIARTAQPSFPM